MPKPPCYTHVSFPDERNKLIWIPNAKHKEEPEKDFLNNKQYARFPVPVREGREMRMNLMNVFS
jgi:hypothetical protein